MNKLTLTAAALIISTTAASAASYRFDAIEGGKTATVTQNCSTNWARTNGAARHWESNGKNRSTRLVMLPKGEACPAGQVIQTKTKKTRKAKK